MSEISHDRYREYLCRLELAAGHGKFGPVAPRKEPKEDDEGGGDGSSEYNPWNRAHPLLGNAAQFSGDYDLKIQSPMKILKRKNNCNIAMKPSLIKNFKLKSTLARRRCLDNTN